MGFGLILLAKKDQANFLLDIDNEKENSYLSPPVWDSPKRSLDVEECVSCTKRQCLNHHIAYVFVIICYNMLLLLFCFELFLQKLELHKIR